MGRRINREWLPDFLGIGAMRSGTTWLARNLRQHPQIWMPPKKEIHYFDRSLSYLSPSLLATSSPLERVVSDDEHNRKWRRALQTQVRKYLSGRDWHKLSWYIRFFLGWYDDRWYASLFKEGRGKVKGEITPSYSLLEPVDVEHVRELMPATKILFILRHPVDRAWSAIRYGRARRGRPLDDLSLAAFKKIIRREGLWTRGDYVRTICTWRKYFPEEQFFAGFFEDIVHRPRRFLIDVFTFLEVEATDRCITDLALQTINPSPNRQMPLQFRLHLAREVYPQIVALSEMLGSHACRWQREVEELLETETS